MDPRRDAYFLAVAEALAECQQVEFQLRFYIGNVITVRETKPSAPVPFKMTEATFRRAVSRHFKKAALGELIGYFEQLSDAPALVTRLRKFTRKRNRLAHRLLAAAIDPDGELDYGIADKLIGEVEMTKSEAICLNDDIHETSIPWIVHLYL
jgi:hypothetical protein